METIPVFLQLPPEHIAMLKFTVESYEGIGIVRTLDAQSGVIVILALPDTLQHVEPIIASLAAELQIQRISPPSSLAGDWLLGSSE